MSNMFLVSGNDKDDYTLLTPTTTFLKCNLVGKIGEVGVSRMHSLVCGCLCDCREPLIQYPSLTKEVPPRMF